MRTEKPGLKTDFHSHVLPGMDDGAADVSVSLSLLRILGEQGISRVYATPHFYLFRETGEAFLARREERLGLLRRELPGAGLPEVFPGAEVCLCHDLAECTRLPEMCYAGTNLILLEIPYTGYQDWMAEEVCNLCYRYRLRPVLAHLDRYVDRLEDRQLETLLSLDDVVVQLNNHSLSHRAGVRFAAALLSEGYDLLFGSDTHNLTTRRPDFDLADRALLKKLKPSGLTGLIVRQADLLAEAAGAVGAL